MEDLPDLPDIPDFIKKVRAYFRLISNEKRLPFIALYLFLGVFLTLFVIALFLAANKEKLPLLIIAAIFGLPIFTFCFSLAIVRKKVDESSWAKEEVVKFHKSQRRVKPGLYLSVILLILEVISFGFFPPAADFIKIAWGIPTPTPTSTFTPSPPPSLTPTPLLTLTSNPTASPTSTITQTPTPTCPYQGSTDNETIENIIRAEANAVNNKSIDIIVSIFAPDALIYDGEKTGKSPIEHYQDDLFINADYKDVEHFDILPAGEGIVDSVAWYSSGSKGYYKSGDVWKNFSNGSAISSPETRYGSDHWTLKRNIAGCWVITKFVINGGHINFPP